MTETQTEAIYLSSTGFTVETITKFYMCLSLSPVANLTALTFGTNKQFLEKLPLVQKSVLLLNVLSSVSEKWWKISI